MFRIGEFSKLAQVSGRQLRHYDHLGLLVPEHTDPFTGYRYYTAQQLPRLNRILALKDLGLSLEEIGRLLNENISSDEIRGLLTAKKAQVEAALREELARFRYIESRIEQIDKLGQLDEYAPVLKSIPKQRLIATRHFCESRPEAIQVMQEIIETLPRVIGQSYIGHFAALLYSELFEEDALDLEMGCLLSEDYRGKFHPLSLHDGSFLQVTELEAVDTMLSVTRIGLAQLGHGSYSSAAYWMTANGYQMAGVVREIFIQPPYPGKEEETVTEIQIPVAKLEHKQGILG